MKNKLKKEYNSEKWEEGKYEGTWSKELLIYTGKLLKNGESNVNGVREDKRRNKGKKEECEIVMEEPCISSLPQSQRTLIITASYHHLRPPSFLSLHLHNQFYQQISFKSRNAFCYLLLLLIFTYLLKNELVLIIQLNCFKPGPQSAS